MNYVGKDTSHNSLSGIPSGLTELDNITKCWKKSSLTVVAGAPSMGCTSLLLAFMRNAAIEFQRKTAFFSLQMRCDKLLTKWLSIETAIPYASIESGNLTEPELTSLNDFIRLWDKDAGFSTMIVDKPNPTISSIVSTCKKLRADGTEFFLIDNLNRITIGKKARAFCANREQELSYIMRRLKTLAHELDAPIILVSQLSRSATEKGMYHRPRLTDLRDSGAIENEADLVIFLYRQEYYNLTEDEMGNPTAGVAELLVAKNRFGELANTKVQFLSRFGLFKNIEIDEWSLQASDEIFTIQESFASKKARKNTIRLGSRMLDEPPF